MTQTKQPPENPGRFNVHGEAPSVEPDVLPAARIAQLARNARPFTSTMPHAPFRAAGSCIHPWCPQEPLS